MAEEQEQHPKSGPRKPWERRSTTPGGPVTKRAPWWPLVFLAVLLALLWFPLEDVARTEIPYTRFKQELERGNVEYLEAKGEALSGRLKQSIKLAQGPITNGQDRVSVEHFTTTMPPFGDDALTSELVKNDVEFVSKGSGIDTFWIAVMNFLPFLLLIGIGWLVLRGIQQRAGRMMSIGRSQAKLFQKERTSVTFDNVAGLKEAKESLKEIISFMKEPDRYMRLGCRVPKGVLLVGPPGAGKTLLARAVAGEAEVPFFSITGSDFMEMFVGVGASRVRDLFRTAKRAAPCIIFVDELDSIGRHRGAGLGGGHDEREQTLNQLLSEIDGFEPKDNVVVIAATNRPDILDPALLRPGRFDRRVVVDLPTFQERVAILKVHARNVPVDETVDFEDLARSMPGRSGADLQHLVNEAALIAARRGKKKVGADEFSTARDEILMGRHRAGVVLQRDEKRAVALHEAGHALVAHATPEADPVEKISIIPRGRSLGATQQLPDERYNLTDAYLRGRIKVMLGGRASEEITLGDVSTGAADDLTQAAKLARRMVGQWGMSEKFSNLAFEEDNQDVFLGEQIARQRPYSERTAREIDLEVKRLVDDCYNQAMELLRAHRERLEKLADALEEEEVLEGERLRELLESKADTEVESPGETQPQKPLRG